MWSWLLRPMLRWAQEHGVDTRISAGEFVGFLLDHIDHLEKRIRTLENRQPFDTIVGSNRSGR
jgi:hypothetical protein